MIRKTLMSTIALALAATAANAQTFTESFDGSSLLPSAWTSINNSPAGAGSNPNWSQTPGSVSNWLPYAGAGYATANYNATVGANDISVYLISPSVTLSNGDTISFWTRTVSSPLFPDRLSLVYSTNGSMDPASFTNTLLTVNQELSVGGYPTEWTQYTATITNLPEAATGRFAFWYNVPSGGPLGDNSDRVGIDEVTYTAIPAPGSFALLSLGGLIIGRRRR